MRDYSHAIFIGRFQPPHNCHLETIRHGLRIADRVIVIIGSQNAAPSPKNPFSFEVRRDLLLQSVSPSERDRVVAVGVRDYFYSDMVWVANVQASVSSHMANSESVALVGQYKDSSSYYLRFFPQWEFVSFNPSDSVLSSVQLRDFLFSFKALPGWDGSPTQRQDVDSISGRVPGPVLSYLKEYVKTPAYAQLCAEAHFLAEYRKAWATAPYPPTFVTVDAVVLCQGHTLVVTRRSAPGQGLYALPGGFVRSSERLQDAAIRELKEETGIRVPRPILTANIRGSHVFDHPDRSLRGRTITHAYCVFLENSGLPEVREGSDALGAQWIPYMDVAKLEHRFFEDHAHIVQHFMTTCR